MYIIVGLGNPGLQYRGTRHNVGFAVVDALAEKYSIRVDSRAHKGLIGNGYIGGQTVIIVKPQTYMNLSGECVRAVADFYKVDSDEILVIYDDISLDVGQLRLRGKGSAGGHNGIKNIILHLGTQVFPRVKVGVGAKDSRIDLKDHVLGHFHGDDKIAIMQGVEDAVAAVECYLENGLDTAMNRYNVKKS